MLASAIMSTTRLMAVQGTEAVRVAEKIAVSQKKATTRSREGGGGGMLSGLAPLAAGELLAKGVEAGASVLDQIARLKAAGASDAEIAKARADFGSFQKTHAGGTESEYLGTYFDARVIAPGEANEMTALGATYRTALRNSGLLSTEYDVSNVMRTMDELGLKTQPEREDFINNILKTQQTFGGQVPTETLLSAYRNAKSSIYGWDPSFRNNVLPTLLQSTGEQGGTEIMTAYNNLVGKHMQQSELRAMASSGFARNQDLIFDKAGNVRGLKPGAKMFEEDVFKANPYQWSLDLHKEYMQRKDATEGGFEDLTAKMPRSMSALIEFFVHNQQRIERDAQTRQGAIGLGAATDATLGQNPGAELAALGAAITQFGAEVTGPAVKAAGPAMLAIAQAVQTAASMIDKAAKDHPIAATAASGGAIAGVAWAGWKVAEGIWNKIFGGGGGGGPAATKAGSGVLGAVGGMASAASLPILIDALTNDNRTPGAKANDAAAIAWIKSWFPGRPSVSGPQLPSGGVPAAMPFLHGRDVHSPQTGPYSYTPREVTVSGQAQVQHTVNVNVSMEPGLMARIEQAISSIGFTVPLIGGGTGRMDSDAAPHRHGGIGSM
jgi:hypothetical protein